jgi:hypothetical protein
VLIEEVGRRGEVPAVSDVDDAVYAVNKTIRGVVVAKIAGDHVLVALSMFGEIGENQVVVRG